MEKPTQQPVPRSSRRAAARRSSYCKSAETRIQVLEAAVECLACQGHRAVTLQRVAQLAGVTRGCVQYYVRSLPDLLIAVQDHIIQCLWGDLLTKVRNLPIGEDRLAHTIDMVLALPAKQHFLAWSELLAAARTRPELEPVVNRGATLLEC